MLVSINNKPLQPAIRGFPTSYDSEVLKRRISPHSSVSRIAVSHTMPGQLFFECNYNIITSKKIIITQSNLTIFL